MAQTTIEPIPQPPSYGPLGNLPSLDRQNPVQGLMRLAEQYGPIYRLDLPGRTNLFISSQELVADACDESRFDKNIGAALAAVRHFTGDGLFTAFTYEPNWEKAHRILLPSFNQRAMQGYHAMMLDLAVQLVQKWQRLNPDESVDVADDMTRLTLDTIGLCGFNYRFNSFYRDQPHPFISAMVRALDEAMNKLARISIQDKLMFTARKQFEADIESMNALVDKLIAERKASGTKIDDLLGHMLSGVDPETGENLSDENIRYQIITFLIAGHETTSGLLSFALYFLIKNPTILEKAREEADRVLVDEAPTYRQVRELKYARMILNESLRLWPTAPAFALYAKDDTLLAGRYEMKKGEFAVVLTPALHRDKAAWGDDVEQFRPERFENIGNIPPHAFKPFGNGQRACIGQQFAMQEATLVLGMVLKHFDLIDHTNYQLKVRETLTMKPDGFHLQVRPRAIAVRAANAEPEPRPTPPIATRGSLLILYGSNMGTAEAIAIELAAACARRGLNGTAAPLDAYAGKLPAHANVIIVTASYNGHPPDNARAFVSWLESAVPDELRGVHYSVFGCGDRNWASTYQRIPELIDTLMASKGAERLADRGAADASADFEDSYNAWRTAHLWPGLTKFFNLPEADATSDIPALTLKFVSGSRAARVLVNRELQSSTSVRSTRHIELALPEGVTYTEGDHLAIQPQNSAALIARVLRRFNLEADASVVISGPAQHLPEGRPVTIGTVLRDCVELQDPASRQQIRALSAATSCPPHKRELDTFLAEESYRAQIWKPRVTMLDLLERYPASELPFDQFLALVPPLKPRYYSIASSPSADPHIAAITVAVIREPAWNGLGEYRGSASNYLADAVSETELQVFVRHPESGFALPQDPSTPIIMVGPGSGIAPFRGFIQARRQQQHTGEAHLYFGCRHPDEDFLYRDELEQADSDGVIQLHTAFSRIPAQPKTYVQHRMQEDIARIADLLTNHNAKLYLCGDGAHMAPDVEQVLTNALGAERVAALQRDKRYVKDVWSG
ncbi:MAG TPA: bifunctional cytochrome P450/NADPH--P450 reductase [Bryobacteraceae bacterium]|jgi:cytochrome P450/NADPH-cytochrome P450 reductase